jgi:hypothetical protein
MYLKHFRISPRQFFPGFPLGSPRKTDPMPSRYVACTCLGDTNIQSRPIQRTALRHAWLSFPLGAVIIATAINLVSGLAK